MSFRFDSFTLDTEARLLKRDGGGGVLHLSPKAFHLLELLLAERPRALAKDALMRELWPSTHVCEDNLTGLVAELRGALGDSPRQARFIRTVHRFGYAFCAEAETVGSPPRRGVSPAPWSLRLLWAGNELRLAMGENVLGRDSGAAARIDVPGVSRQHARITVRGGEATIEDLGSKNGTYVGGVRLAAPCLLADGDELRLGGAILTFRATRAEASTQTLAV